jgi:tRNA-binding EMAP/Myf-like protein
MTRRQITFVSLRQIAPGQELTHDWATTDNDDYTITCHCDLAEVLMSSFVPAKVKPSVAFSVFESLDIRLGTITSVSDVQGSRKLLDLTVDFGNESRHILAGI